MTIREWFETIKNKPNTKFGISMEKGLICRTYVDANEFEKTFDGWLDEKCSAIFPENFTKNGISYCLFQYV